MAIRPKVGARVVFSLWYNRMGEEAPPSPWIGTVECVFNDGVGPTQYTVRRDADNQLTILRGRDMWYEKRKTE